LGYYFCCIIQVEESSHCIQFAWLRNDLSSSIHIKVWKFRNKRSLVFTKLHLWKNKSLVKVLIMLISDSIDLNILIYIFCSKAHYFLVSMFCKVYWKSGFLHEPLFCSNICGSKHSILIRQSLLRNLSKILNPHIYESNFTP
jgi:hypothetical protein